MQIPLVGCGSGELPGVSEALYSGWREETQGPARTPRAARPRVNAPQHSTQAPLRRRRRDGGVRRGLGADSPAAGTLSQPFLSVTALATDESQERLKTFQQELKWKHRLRRSPTLARTMSGALPQRCVRRAWLQHIRAGRGLYLCREGESLATKAHPNR